MQIVTHKEAKIKGLKRFNTGEACAGGHVAERLTSSRECVECKRAREARKYAADPSRHQQQYLTNRDRRLIQQKTADDARRSEKVEYGREWRKQNCEYAKQYTRDNAGLFRYHAALRRARKKQATPPWAELDAIRQLYLECERVSQETGIPHDVDHEIPLVHHAVCGLHCMANLRIITQEENGRKKNTFSVDG